MDALRAWGFQGKEGWFPGATGEALSVQSDQDVFKMCGGTCAGAGGPEEGLGAGGSSVHILNTVESLQQKNRKVMGFGLLYT